MALPLSAESDARPPLRAGGLHTDLSMIQQLEGIDCLCCGLKLSWPERRDSRLTSACIPDFSAR